MADLSYIQSAGSTKIIGSDATGAESTPVAATPAGGMHVNLRDDVGDVMGSRENPVYVNSDSRFFFPLSSLKIFRRKVLAAGAAFYDTQTVPFRTAIKEFHVGGRVACEGTLAKYLPNEVEFLPGGGFNSSGDVSLWTNTGIGDSAAPVWQYNTDQFFEGTGSARFLFIKSDDKNYPEITYTYSTPQDWSVWRKIAANVRASVAEGGAQTRTVSIRVRSGTAIRIWQITGTTTTAPFSTEQWLTVMGELESPTATAGTGTFDINAVDSVSLRLEDGGNKTGTIWWDNVHLEGELQIIDKIYTSGNTVQLLLDPVVIFEENDELMLVLRNNGATSAELEVATSGIDIS